MKLPKKGITRKAERGLNYVCGKEIKYLYEDLNAIRDGKMCHASPSEVQDRIKSQMYGFLLGLYYVEAIAQHTLKEIDSMMDVSIDDICQRYRSEGV